MRGSIFAVFALFSSFVQASGATIDCNTGCPFDGSPYNITCTSTSSGSCSWYSGSTKVMTCADDGSCAPEVSGYTGYRINNSYYVLLIQSLSASTIQCRVGSDSPTSCQVTTVTEVPSGKLNASCGQDEVGCSGLTSHGTPPVTLELKKDDTVLSTTTEKYLVSTKTIGETYTCGVTGNGSQCLSPVSVTVTCAGSATHSTSAGVIAGVTISLFLLIAVIAVAVFLTRKGFRCVLLRPGSEVVNTERQERSGFDENESNERTDEREQTSNVYDDLTRREAGKQTSYESLKIYQNAAALRVETGDTGLDQQLPNKKNIENNTKIPAS